MGVTQETGTFPTAGVLKPQAGDIALRLSGERRTINQWDFWLGNGLWVVRDTLGYSFAVAQTNIPNQWDEVVTA